MVSTMPFLPLKVELNWRYNEMKVVLKGWYQNNDENNLKGTFLGKKVISLKKKQITGITRKHLETGMVKN